MSQGLAGRTSAARLGRERAQRCKHVAADDMNPEQARGSAAAASDDGVDDSPVGRHAVGAGRISVEDLIARTSSNRQVEVGFEPSQRATTKGPTPHKWWTLVAVCLGTFMLLLDVTIVNVALPDIQTALHASFADLQWVVDAYALTLAALLL